MLLFGAWTHMTFVGISKSTFCNVIWKHVIAVVIVPQLEMKFQTTQEAVTKVDVGFSKSEVSACI